MERYFSDQVFFSRKLNKKGPVSTFTNTNHVMLCFYRCLSVHWGGACMAGGHAWWKGVCMVREHAQQGSVHGGGVRGRGHASQERWPLQQAERILLECILVFLIPSSYISKSMACSDLSKEIESCFHHFA